MSWNIRHIRQKYPVTCGSCSYGQIIGITEQEAILEVKNDENGTHTFNVVKALKNRKIPHLQVNYDLNFAAARPYLELLSFQYPLYVSSEYRSGAVTGERRGRDLVRDHACTIWKGKVYDPACEYVFPIDSYSHVWNKSMKVKEIIICGIDITA